MERFQTDHRELDDLFERYKSAPKSHVFAPLADACRKAGMLEEALEICSRGLRENPRYASGYVVQGKCLYDAGRSGDAQAAFERVLEIDPKNLVALKFLGILHAERGDFESAKGFFEDILVLDPDDREIRSRIEDVDVASVLAPQASVRAPYPPVIDPMAESESDEIEADEIAVLPEAQDEGFEGAPITLRDETVTSDEIATITLADIYASQGYRSRALKIYREVHRRQPGNTELAAKIEKLTLETTQAMEASRAEADAAELNTGFSSDAKTSAPAQKAHRHDQESAPVQPALPPPPAGNPIDQSQSYEQFKRWLKASSR